MFNERFARCWVCGFRAGLGELLRRLGAEPPAWSPPPPPRPRPDAPWLPRAEALVAGYRAALDAGPLWHCYRPFTLASVLRFELGVGVLPACSCPHRRLVHPVREGGRIVALRGRAIACDCAKVLYAAGSTVTLFGLDSVRAGDPVLVCENPADAMLAAQELPDYRTLAMGGSHWREGWTAALAKRDPLFVLFWPDHDPAGYRGAAAGANELRAAGVEARVYRWPQETPARFDFGAFLIAGMGSRSAA